MGEKLKNPPIVEAACGLRFDPSGAWDWTIPGQLFERIKDEFPERSQLKGLGIQVHLGPNGPSGPEMLRGPERVQLKRSDGSAMVQVGERLLAVIHLRPYPDWESFRELILRVLGKYLEIAGAFALKRIGLRYINRIEVPKHPLHIGDFVTVNPPLSGALERPLGSFYQRYELLHDTPAGVLIHQTGLQKSGEKQYVMLDLDFGSLEVSHLRSQHSVGEWLDSAHGVILNAFVASLNPLLYKKMREGE